MPHSDHLQINHYNQQRGIQLYSFESLHGVDYVAAGKSNVGGVLALNCKEWVCGLDVSNSVLYCLQDGILFLRCVSLVWQRSELFSCSLHSVLIVFKLRVFASRDQNDLFYSFLKENI